MSVMLVGDKRSDGEVEEIHIRTKQQVHVET